MAPLLNAMEDQGLHGDTETREAAARSAALTMAELVPLVHRQMRSLVGPSRDVEDLTQSALEQVLRSVSRFEGRSEMSTFTYRICAHVVMNHWRWWRRWLRRFELDNDETERAASHDPNAPDAVVERARAVRLHTALARLSPAKRLILTLSDLEELPATQVAEIMGCPEPTVRSRLRQARIDLCAILRRDPLFAEDAGRASR